MLFRSMINQDQLFFLDAHEISTGNGTDVFSTGINHRECTVTGFRHNVFDLVGKIIAPEDHQIVFFHKILDRNTLVDQTGHGKGIVRCGNDHLISLLCQFLDRLSDFRSQTHDQAACVCFDRTQLIFRTVYCLAGCSKPILRLWISSMEDDAIRSGFQQLKSGRD